MEKNKKIESAFKEAYREFAVSMDQNLARLYQSFDQFNAQYWEGGLPDVILELSHGLGRRVLGRYTTVTDYLCSYRIQINRKFYERNEYSRVEKTLLHEMIHLWQHINNHKLGHNRSFRDEAARIELPVEGRSCSTGPANMPSPGKKTPVWGCGCQVVRKKVLNAVCSKCGREFSLLEEENQK